jgi:hypothetical protein
MLCSRSGWAQLRISPPLSTHLQGSIAWAFIASSPAAWQVSNGLQTLVPNASGAGLSVPDHLRIVDNYVKVSHRPHTLSRHTYTCSPASTVIVSLFGGRKP